MTDAALMLAQLEAMPPDERGEALRAAGERHVREIDNRWPLWAHRGQTPPHDDWDIWVMLAGRGFGKTRAGAEWVSARARETPGARIALIAATPAEARRVMVEGRGGLFAAARDGEERAHMRWEPGLGRLTFASGAVAHIYSGANPDALRGPEHHFGWCDELAKWKRAGETWDNLLLGLRAGAHPQAVVTTTPKPVPALRALRALLAMARIVLTGGATRDNPHMPPAFLDMIHALHAGTRLGRQELEGKLLEDVENALWPRAVIEANRVPSVIARTPDLIRGTRQSSGTTAGEAGLLRSARNDEIVLKRVVIGVDPPATAEGDACGIIVCGLDSKGTAYVLADNSAAGLSPEGWARRVAEAAETWRADRVVAEGNNGGEMVETVLKGAGLRLKVKRVHARVGKSRRAEPIAAFFERGEAKFAGRFPELEDELAGLTTGGDYLGPGRSPDRADACVWALTELLLEGQRGEPRIRQL